MNINILRKYYKSDFSIHDFYYIHEKTLNIYQISFKYYIHVYYLSMFLFIFYFILKNNTFVSLFY